MKKLTAICLIFIMLLSLCGCNDPVPEYITRCYPDAEITQDYDSFKIITPSDIGLTKNVHIVGYSEGWCYETFEEFHDSLNLNKNIIIVGQKQSEATQCITFDKDNVISQYYYTETKLEVKEVFYGNVNVGDVIILRENFAKLSDIDGNERVCGTAHPANEEEHLFVLDHCGESKLYEGDCYSNHTETITPLRLSDYRRYSPDSNFNKVRIQSELYEKYVVNGDTAIDTRKESEKLLDYYDRMKNSSNKRIKKILKDYKRNPETLTEYVESMAEKYGRI